MNKFSILPKICVRCVMDSTDSKISFDQNGLCDYCQNFDQRIKKKINDKKNNLDIVKLSNKIRNVDKSKYDCLIGISGGVDSSFLAHYVKTELKLNPLVIHVDTGWNSINSSSNIERMIDALSLDLVTIVIPWKEMRDLQLSFFKAQHPNLDIPQDHAIFASIYNYAAKNNIKYIFTGGNFATECIREPLEWAYHASDLKHLKEVHKIFGKEKLVEFPTCDIFRYKIFYRFFKGIKVIQPLNEIDYNKEKSIKLLQEKYGWIKYENKHYESRFTKFYEGYWLLNKFGFDKRKAHLSSLILTNQITRNEALKNLSKKPINERDSKNEFEFVCKKLEISKEELMNIMRKKNKKFNDYKSNYILIQFFVKLSRFLRLENRLIR